MRFVIGILVLSISFFLGVSKCKFCMKKVEKSKFLLRLSDSLIANNHSEMLSFFDVFLKVYGDNVDIKEVYDSETALKYIEDNYKDAKDFTVIFPNLKKLTLCGAWEFDNVSSELKAACQNALDTEENSSKKDGLTAAVLYPGIAALLLTVLI